MYTALRLQAAQVRVTRPAGSSEPRRGTRWMSAEPQEGQTRGFRSRSAAIKIRASGARYSLMPRRPIRQAPSAGSAHWRPRSDNLPISGNGEQSPEHEREVI